jgi:hypothetical protein
MMVQTTGWSFESVAQCEICGSPERRRLGIRTPQPLTRSLRMPDGLPSTSVFACSGCGLIYSDPRPSGNSVEDVYGTIDDYFCIPIDEQRMRFYRDLATRLAALQPAPGRMLDVGCGRGEFVCAARSVGWDAHGIDPDRHFPEFARQRFGLTTVRALDLADVVSAGERYDAITLNAVLEHIPRPQETLRVSPLRVQPRRRRAAARGHGIRHAARRVLARHQSIPQGHRSGGPGHARVLRRARDGREPDGPDVQPACLRAPQGGGCRSAGRTRIADA